MEAKKNNAKKKKLATAIAAGLLVAGVAGGGAVVTMNTTLADNLFQAEVPSEDTVTQGALLQVSGDPLVHTFDVTRFNDTIAGEWTLTNIGEATAPFDGTLAPVGSMSETLAENLTVQYGTVANGQTTWHNAGTLANPVSYTDALQLSEVTLDGGGATQQIPVRVTLADPTQLDGVAGEELQVNATFTVNYIDPASAL